MAQARSARAINRRGKSEDGSDREDEVKKILISYISIVCLKDSATISIYEERLQISEAGRFQVVSTP